MSEIVKLILCPICKGSGTGKYERNILGNLEASVCLTCSGIGYISSKVMLPDQPDDTPMTHTYSNTAEISFTQSTLEDIINTIKKLEGDSTAYAIVDTKEGKIYSIKKESLSREFIDIMLNKSAYYNKDYCSIEIKPEEYKCNFCGKIFNLPDYNLKELANGEDLSWYCEICDKITRLTGKKEV